MSSLRWLWLPFLLLLNCPNSRQENLRPDKTDFGAGVLPHLVYSLPEESPRGTIIAKLRDDIETMLGGHQPVSPQSLQITNWQDRGPRHFGIEPNSGYLIVNAQPNREALCPDSSLPTGFSLPSLSQPSLVDAKFGSNDAGKGGHQRMTSPAAPERPCSLLLRIVFAPQPQAANASSERDEPAPGALEPILLSVTVVVTDVNDHAPTFPQNRISFELGETSAVPETTTITLPAATDPDAGENGTISYWLEERPGGVGASHRTVNGYTLLSPTLSQTSWNSTFPFRLEGSHEGGQPLQLRLINALDYEQVKAYDFVLHAEDHGRPKSLSSQLAIHIDVLDENDNPPVFERIHNFVIINESLPRGSVLLDLRASDADSSRNGQVSFEIPMAMTEEENVVKQFFEVRTVASGYAKLYLRQSLDLDQDVGELGSLAKLTGGLGTLDGEGLSVRRSRDYHVRIQATDNGSPRRQTADAYVTVRVLDVNDMVPRISISYINTAALVSPQQAMGLSPMPPAASGAVSSAALYSSVQRGHGVIPENTERRFLALVTVQDLDSGPWGQVRCRTDNDAFQLVPIGQGAAASAGLETPQTGYFGAEATADPGSGAGTVSANQEITFKLVAMKAFDREEVEQISFRVLCVDNFVKTGQLQTFVENLQPPESKTTFDPNLLLDLGSQALKSEQPEPSGPLSDRLGTAQSNKYSVNQPMGQQQQQHQQQLQQQQRHQHPNRDRELVQGDQGMSPVYMFTDRVIIFVLSAIFVVLLIVTMVLIFLIRRRRFMEMHPGRTHKHPGKPQVRNNIETPVLQCTTNSLQLIQADGGTGTAGKTAVFFRKDVPSDGTSQADSDGRSGLGNDSYPQQALITSEDSYTLLKALGRNQMAAIPAGELAPSVCKAYGHCLPLTSFAPVVQVNNGIPTRGAYLGQPVMPGFAPIFSMPSKTASTGAYVSIPKQGTTGGVVQSEAGRRTVSPDHLIFGTNFTSPKRLKPSGQQSPFNDLPNYLSGVEEGRRSEYQKLIQPKTGPLVGRASNLRRSLNQQKDQEHGVSLEDLEGHRWPSSHDVEANEDEGETEEDEDEGCLAEAMGSEDHRRSSFRTKAATLQALHRSTSSDWHLPNNAAPCDIQQQKFVKFSTSNISLNKLPSPPVRKNPIESHYV
nr:unnamed protein product [Spirometra erinaceieuropaei]